MSGQLKQQICKDEKPDFFCSRGQSDLNNSIKTRWLLSRSKGDIEIRNRFKKGSFMKHNPMGETALSS